MQTEGLTADQRQQLAAMACGGIAYISNLAVMVDMRRQGIGLELLRAAEQVMPLVMLADSCDDSQLEGTCTELCRAARRVQIVTDACQRPPKCQLMRTEELML